MKIYNSLEKSKVDFEPVIPGEISMYVCGVTPYDYAHIGNARPAIIFDTLYRFLKAQGNKVTYVRNFTDVDDKIIARANEGNGNWQALTQKYIEIYHNDMAALNVYSSGDKQNYPNSTLTSPDIIEPKVTKHIPEIIEMIKILLENGHAYVSKAGDVLYNTTKFAEYGKLSGNCLENLNMGQRIAVSTDKKHEADFVLWKSVKENEPMQWDFDYTDNKGNAVNAGRPGWHIECSAMSKKLLGETFDIHGGGEDLKFPHHECEIAQSKGSCGDDAEFARYWMHNAFINVGGEKMSKSLGNFKTIHGLLEKYSGEALRLWMLSTHYRKPVDLTEQALEQAEKKIKSWYLTLSKFEGEWCAVEPKENLHTESFISSMQDDLNTAEALAGLHNTMSDLNKIESLGNDGLWVLEGLKYRFISLGLILQKPSVFLKGDTEIDVDALVKQRDQAKANKDWALSDEIRDDLKAQGIVLEDGANGTTWRKA